MSICACCGHDDREAYRRRQAEEGEARVAKENDRLLAALVPTEDDIAALDSNVELHTILQEIRNGGSEKRLWRAVRSAHLAILRAKAGLPIAEIT